MWVVIQVVELRNWCRKTWQRVLNIIRGKGKGTCTLYSYVYIGLCFDDNERFETMKYPST